MDPLPSLPPDSGTRPPATSPDARHVRVGPFIVGWRRAVIAAAAIALLLLLTLAWTGTGYRYEPYVEAAPLLTAGTSTEPRNLKALALRLRGRDRELSARLQAAAPRGDYIVIDQSQNRLYLKRDDKTLLQAKCSAGSGLVLKESSGKKREWVFDTPRGKFAVQTLLRQPVWVKPDWAFVEEGQPIPKNPADRMEYDSLGEYALYFGNGFMIHGTLYERLLGRAVSHGCIRVGRNDLRQVWAHARIGMPIYIY